MPDWTEVGDRLAKLRRRDESVKEFAARAGVPHETTMSAYLKGRGTGRDAATHMSFQKAEDIARALDVSPWFLLYGVEAIADVDRRAIARRVREEIEERVTLALVKGNWEGTTVHRDIVAVFQSFKKRGH